MKTIKAVVSDFDGTLVDHTHQLPPEVHTAIKSFVQSGHIFSIATGRAYEGVVENIIKDLGLKGLHIVRGGSEIISSPDDKVVWGKYINPATVTYVLSLLSTKLHISFAAERGKYIYSKDGGSHSEFGAGAKFKSLNAMPADIVPKIVLPPIHQQEVIMPILDELTKKFADLHVVRITSKKGMGLDINDAGAGKHIALLEYAKLMKLNPSEILGVGDSYNDYPLLTACGIKVAMGNAPAELKEIADHIVGSHEENGILEVLKLVNQH